MHLSIVTTLYRSEATVREFHRRISAAARQLTDDYEIIMVDDGSPDGSLQAAVELVAQDPRLKVIELSRNFGHHRAMMTGLAHAAGELVFLIDVDLEEDPELLARFWQIWHDEDVDVVYGLQQKRKGALFERLSGAFAYAVFRLLLPVRIPVNHITVRLMSRDYVRALVAHRERQTVIGGLWVITGFRQLGVPVAKGSRRATTYKVGRKVHALVESVTSFSEVPLIGVFYLGIFIMSMSVIGAVYLIWRRLSGVVLGGWTSTLVSIWFLGGLTVFSIGVVGLYVSRIFLETKQRPYTIVRRVYGAEAGGAARPDGHGQVGADVTIAH